MCTLLYIEVPYCMYGSLQLVCMVRSVNNRNKQNRVLKSVCAGPTIILKLCFRSSSWQMDHVIHRRGV